MTRFGRKKRKKPLFNKKVVLGIFITFIMIFSGAGLFFSGSGNSPLAATYGDYKFSYANGLFTSNIDGKRMQFYYLPDEVQAYNISESLLLKINATRQIDVTSDFSSQAAQDIAAAQFHLQQIMAEEGKYVRMGFLAPTPYNNTIITCDTATQFVPVLVFEYTNETSIDEVGNCVYIRATTADQFMRVTHNIIYKILGVI